MPSFRGRKVDVVLDVRSKLECLLGKAPGAVNIPLGRLERELPRRTDIARNAVVLVYCAAGVRAAQAVALMRRMGYANVVDGGGIAAVRGELRPE
jgi:rhodanese-related sulfurtransferase